MSPEAVAEVDQYKEMLERVEAVCATIENLSVPSAGPTWHISGEKSAVAKIRAAINGSVVA